MAGDVGKTSGSSGPGPGQIPLTNLTEAQKAKKTKGAQGAASKGGISRKKAGKGKGAENVPPKVDIEKPRLNEPVRVFAGVELDGISESVKSKLASPVAIDKAQEVADGFEAEAKQRVENAARFIGEEVLNSDKSSAYKFMLIQMALMDVMGIQIDVNATYAKQLSIRQREQADKVYEAMKQRIESAAQSGVAGQFKKAFAWIGKILNVIGAAVSTYMAVAGTALTGGAATPLVAAAALWLSGAVLGIIEGILDESGAMGKLAEAISKDNPQMARMIMGFVSMAIQIGLSIGAAGISWASAGASAIGTAEAQAEAIYSIYAKAAMFAEITQAVGDATASTVKAVSDYQVTMAEAEKVGIEGEKQKLLAYVRELRSFMENQMKLMTQLAQTTSSVTKSEIEAKRNIIGRI